MAEEFHKPALFGGREFEAYAGGDDPAALRRVAHESAHALLARVRASGDAGVLERVVNFTDEHGIDALAELWARSAARTLPGALWRIYLVRLMIRDDPEGVGLLFQRGTEVLPTIDVLVAGASIPVGPGEVIDVADRILRGVFDGDLALALDRAAAFCRVTAAGAVSVADDYETTGPERATDLTTRALRLSTIAEELGSAARLARSDALD
jgi:hypothetical protein